MYTITPIAGVNVRSGPGMEYDITYRLPPNQSVEYFETKKDTIGVLWYKTPIGWVCGKYVTLAEDAQKPLMRLELFAGEELESEVRDVVKTKLNNGTDYAVEVADSAGNVIKRTVYPAAEAAQGAAATAMEASSNAYGAATATASQLSDYAGEAYNGAANTLKNVGGNIMGAARGVWGGVAESDLGQGVTRTVETAGNVVDGLIQRGTGAIGNAIGGVSDFLNSGLGASANDNLMKRRIFGMPYQFLKTTDIRDENENAMDKELGITYKKMVMESPRLFVVPGKPMFLPDLSAEQRKTYLQAMNKFAEDLGDHITEGIKQYTVGDNAPQKEMKFFTFKQDFTTFIRYVNSMCWVTAIMMNIGDDPVFPGVEGDGNTYRTFDWATFTLAHSMAGRDAMNGSFASEGLSSVADKVKNGTQQVAADLWSDVQKAWDKAMTGKTEENGPSGLESALKQFSQDKYYTEFYIDPSVSFSETHTNNLRPSMLAEIANKGSDIVNELNFFLDTKEIGDFIGRSSEAIHKTVGSIFGDGGGLGASANMFVNRFLQGASSVFSGAVLQFPEIWSGYNFSRNYNVEINLKAAYGDKHSIFIDEFVPMWFWNCLTMPRQHSPNAYRSPFLIRCHIPGIVNTDMGVVTSLTRTIGENSARTVEGYPLEMKLSINITELISEISISRINFVSLDDAYNFLWNTALMDYIASLSACDLRSTDYMKKAQIAKALAKNAMQDTWQHPIDGIAESISNAVFSLITGK